MKKFFLLLVSAGLILASCDQPTPEKASAYYASIVPKTNVLTQEVEDDLIASFKKYIPSEMEKKFDVFEEYVKNLDREFDGKQPFYEDASLIKAANNLIDGYVKVIPLYEEKVEIESLPDTLYTIEKQNRSKDIMQEINLVLNTLNEIYIKETYAFADKYKFPLKSAKKK